MQLSIDSGSILRQIMEQCFGATCTEIVAAPCPYCVEGTTPLNIRITLQDVFTDAGDVPGAFLNNQEFELDQATQEYGASTGCLWYLKTTGPESNFDLAHIDPAEPENWAGINLGSGWWLAGITVGLDAGPNYINVYLMFRHTDGINVTNAYWTESGFEYPIDCQFSARSIPWDNTTFPGTPVAYASPPDPILITAS